MKHPFARVALGAAACLAAAGAALVADGTRFSDFTPLAASAGPTADESRPLTLGNPNFLQQSIADRFTQTAAGIPNSGSWDMNAVNETGPQKGRYLFTVFETGQSGVQRQDLLTGAVDTIWQAVAPGDAIRFDPSTWTPWGTLITGEEDWGGSSVHGRLFELQNPIDAPPIFNPVTAASNVDARFVHQNIIPRAAHEGLQFDKAGSLYFVDENSGGCIYKYTPAAPLGRIIGGQADYFAAGQVFVLRVGSGNTPGATGAFTWVPLTDATGAPLPGAVVITDVNGTSIDGRATTDVPAFKGTDYDRPEDLQIQTVRGREYLYVNPTGADATYRIDLAGRTVSIFADQSTVDLATGLPVGTAFNDPDNLAIDADGNLYIVEDQPGGVNDDIWFAKDLNGDGDLLDPGEGIGRWATNGTVGSEFTGLYFDPTNKRQAWVHIQHPASGNDRTIEITIP
jgi:hypothetical protein